MSARWPVSPSAVALDLLDDDERAVADRLLADDAGFAAAVAEQRELGGALSAMPSTIRTPEPPPPLRPEPTRAHVGRAGARGLLRLPRFTLPALATVAAAAVLAVVLISGGDEAPVTPAPVKATVTLKPIGEVTGTATIKIDGDRAKLTGAGLPPSAEGKHYEAWLARADGSMKPMGEFRVGDDGTVEAGMPFKEDLSEFTYVDVSVEPDGGPPTHSGTSVLRADL
ncbi:MAG: anti-sigma factor [Baekduia sp.]